MTRPGQMRKGRACNSSRDGCLASGPESRSMGARRRVAHDGSPDAVMGLGFLKHKRRVGSAAETSEDKALDPSATPLPKQSHVSTAPQFLGRNTQILGPRPSSLGNAGAMLALDDSLLRTSKAHTP